MLGFVKVVPQPIVILPKLSDAIMEGHGKYKQAIGKFRSGDKMCALMVAYTEAWGCPWWMGNDESTEPSWKWSDLSFLKKFGVILLAIPIVPAVTIVLATFLTRLKLHYRVPYSVLWSVMSRNDRGHSFPLIVDQLRRQGY